MAQGININLTKNTIYFGEYFGIELTFGKDNKKEFKVMQNYFFPDIPDCQKMETTYNEEVGSFSIVQLYKPLIEGKVSLPPIKLKFKDFTIRFQEQKVFVKKNKNNKVEEKQILPEDLTFETKQPEVRYEIITDKKSVYAGEAIDIKLVFAISPKNISEFTFLNLQQQKINSIEKLKSTTSIIEDYTNPNTIRTDSFSIGGERCLGFVLFEGKFYPLDSTDIPMSVPNITLMCYDVAKVSGLGVFRKPRLYTIGAKPIKIGLKKMKHSGREKRIFPVGAFTALEQIKGGKPRTGASFKYTISIEGNSHPNLMYEPIVHSNDYFDIYAPQVKVLHSFKQGNKATMKSFTYYVTPKEPGTYRMSDYFKWVYFNSESQMLDTLQLATVLNIKGQSLKNTYISVNNPGDFYNKIYIENNTLVSITEQKNMRLILNTIAGFLIVFMLYIFLKPSGKR